MSAATAADRRTVMDDHFAATMHLAVVLFATNDQAVIDAVNAVFEDARATQSTLQLTDQGQTALHATPQNLGVRIVPQTDRGVQRENHTPSRMRRLVQRGLEFLHGPSPSSCVGVRSVGDDAPAPGQRVPGAGRGTDTEAAS